MRKEILFSKKKALQNNMIWYVRDVIKDEEIKNFSESQLKLLSDILKRADEYRSEKSPFFTLSSTEIIQKSSGAIASFDDSGKVRNVSEDYIMSGAAAQIYKMYEKKKLE